MARNLPIQLRIGYGLDGRTWIAVHSRKREPRAFWGCILLFLAVEAFLLFVINKMAQVAGYML